MHKISLTSLILLGLSGCATPIPQSPDAALLNFTDLAAEITVQHEVIDSSPTIRDDTRKNSVD